jgi:hypothetical protein
MPTIQLQAEVSAEELLSAVEQLDPAELDRFVDRVIALRARRRTPCLGHDETELLRQINQGLPPAVRARYQELIGKRDARTLTPEEHDELLRLTDEVEEAEASRAQALDDLARLRGRSLSSLMQDLGIPSPTDG